MNIIKINDLIYLKKKKKFRISSKFNSIKSQIIKFTIKIKKLTYHIKLNKKDIHSKNGLFKIINKRKKILKYLENIDSVMHKYILSIIKEYK